MSDTITVDIWSDVACPWCYIGKRRFESGVEQFVADGGEHEVEVTYHSFELSPDTPVDFDGGEVDFLAEHKGMPREQVQAMLEHVSGVAASVGLDYDFDALRHTNTVKAHELLHFAKRHGRQLELAERLFRAYFVEGRHLGRLDVLVELAGEVGLDREEARRALEGSEHLDEVRADQQQASALGAQGVPFYVIDRRYAISGAQDPGVFAGALARVAGERVAS